MDARSYLFCVDGVWVHRMEAMKPLSFLRLDRETRLYLDSALG